MDEPYTHPDDDPFGSQSHLQHLHERRTQHDRNTLLDSWRHSPCGLRLGSSSNPYLAYPDLPRQPVRHRTDSCSSYDLVDDDDIPDPTPRSLLSRLTPPRLKSRHSRSSSLLPFAPSSDTLLSPPRPSFSSSSSSSLRAMSTSTLALPETPTKPRLSFFRPRTPISPKHPYPTHTLSNITDADDDEDSTINNLDFLPPPSNRFSRASSQSSASVSSFHLPSKRDPDKLYFSSLTRSGKKKRKLIVSGIGATEARKLDGLKRWCETFGELRSITRLPNGDVQIDFRDPEVANSVCRVRAKVFIAGVGSVQLSWIMGNKR